MNIDKKEISNPFNKTTEYNSRLFSDRKEAGKILAKSLKKYISKDSLIFAIPCGGVCVASEIARIYKLPLETIVSRKLHAPNDGNIVFGAVAPGDVVVIDDTTTRFLDMSEGTIEQIIQQEIKIMKQKMSDYGSILSEKTQKNKTVILVDDEVVTGMSMHAAIISVKMLLKPKKIIVAAPVGSRDAIIDLAKIVDEVICIDQPAQASVLSEWYMNYPKVTDTDVKDYIQSVRKGIKM
jgi:predicted phosphoribosyltransferase